MRGRIRTFKPSLFQNEELWNLGVSSGMPMLQIFQGLWCYADRDGRFEWKPLVLRGLITPFWGGDFAEALHLLEQAGFICSYAVNNRLYGHIPGFSKHQAINGKEGPSELPEPPEPREENACLTRASRVDDASLTRPEQDLHATSLPFPSLHCDLKPRSLDPSLQVGIHAREPSSAPSNPKPELPIPSLEEVLGDALGADPSEATSPPQRVTSERESGVFDWTLAPPNDRQPTRPDNPIPSPPSANKPTRSKAPKEPKPPKPKPARFVPDDWQPHDGHREKAQELGVLLHVEVQRFRCHEFKTPKTNWDLAFHGWLARASQYGTSSGARPYSSRQPRIGEHGWRRQPDVEGAVNDADYEDHDDEVANG